MPTRLKNLCEAAKEMYGQQYDQLVARSSVSDLNVTWENVEVEDDGEKIVLHVGYWHLKNHSGLSRKSPTDSSDSGSQS